MILVITGMDPFQFDRVVKAIDELAGSGKLGAEEVLIQLGACTYVPRHCKHQKAFSFPEISQKIRESSVVLTHAGAGSTLNCIHNGKHPVIIPRLKEHDEVIDNHQIPFAERLDRFGLATMVLEMNELFPAIEKARGRSGGEADRSNVGGLVGHLEGVWRSIAR
jgi:UDP-N-acetylglucosamine transferase subunit ALG13